MAKLQGAFGVKDGDETLPLCHPHRAGKWYPDLSLARKQAAAIGAGFLDTRTGMFVAYRDTRLETRRQG